jgi:hypothetical protein
LEGKKGWQRIYRQNKYSTRLTMLYVTLKSKLLYVLLVYKLPGLKSLGLIFTSRRIPNMFSYNHATKPPTIVKRIVPINKKCKKPKTLTV